jgi:hypothetical protein
MEIVGEKRGKTGNHWKGTDNIGRGGDGDEGEGGTVWYGWKKRREGIVHKNGRWKWGKGCKKGGTGERGQKMAATREGKEGSSHSNVERKNGRMGK